MSEIDTDQMDHDFFDILYQQWAQTTGAEKTYWMPEEDEGEWAGCREDDYFVEGVGWQIFSVNRETNSKDLVASRLSEADADFICGLHGAVPDLIRRLHELVDFSARKDEGYDLAQGQLAEALLENQGLQQQLHELERELR